MYEPFHHIAATTVFRDSVFEIGSAPGRSVRQVATISRKSAMISGALERTGTNMMVSIAPPRHGWCHLALDGTYT